MPAVDLEAYVARSGGVDLSAFAWDDVPRHPLSPETIRTLRYMQDVESHTIIYLRELLSTRAVDEPDVATFLACWLYEETLPRARARALPRGGRLPGRRAGAAARPGAPRQAPGVRRRRPSCPGPGPTSARVHMTWGAINELTTLTGYRRLAKVAGHPVLTALLERIMLDESRHFFFYYRQAEERLRRPGAARVARLIVDRFWAPVGSGEQAKEELRFLAGYLFGGDEGRAAARKVDETIRRLPGFETVRLVEAWIDSFADSRPRLRGGRAMATMTAEPYRAYTAAALHARRARLGDDPVRRPPLARSSG